MGDENGGGKAKPKCFVISEIGESGTPQRKRADQVLKYIIKPTLSERFEVFRADDIGEPGVITVQIAQALVDSELVVADLTNHNPNVFYELALRHAIRKPFIQIYDPTERIPFDVAQSRSIPLDVRDLDSVDAAKRLLNQQADAVMQPDHEPESLLSLAIDLQAMRGGDKTERVLADILAALEGLRAETRPLSVGHSALVEALRKEASIGLAYGERPGPIGAQLLQALGSTRPRTI